MANEVLSLSRSVERLRELVEEACDRLQLMDGKLDHLIEQFKLHRNSRSNGFKDLDG